MKNKNSVFFDFTKGSTARYLRETMNLEFDNVSSILVKPIQGINQKKLEYRNDGFAFYKDKQGDEYLMFLYLKRYNTFENQGFPKYHITKCETVEKYKGFISANKMPVNIYSNDEKKIYYNQKLKLCENCSKKVFEDMWGYDKPWYESVLKYIDEQENPSFLSNGYHAMWKQISTAYREKANWECETENCINLSEMHEREYLHTHHKNGDKTDNNQKNLQALCILCHSLEHQNKLKNGNSFPQLKNFIRNNKDRLSKIKLQEYNQIMNNF